MKLIYSVEDNKDIREIISMAIESADMAIQCFADSPSMFDALALRRPDLILLDIMLPIMDGEETLRRIRERVELRAVPVIMVSAKGSEYEKVKLLNLGASDYITKPFGVLELIARVKANLKRQVDTKLTFGEYIVDTLEHRIELDGVDLALTDKEYQLLRMLLENRGKVIDKDVILSAIWGENFEVETRTLNMVILRLRGKLTESAIDTVRGIGFRLN